MLVFISFCQNTEWKSVTMAEASSSMQAVVYFQHYIHVKLYNYCVFVYSNACITNMCVWYWPVCVCFYGYRGGGDEATNGGGAKEKRGGARKPDKIVRAENDWCSQR